MPNLNTDSGLGPGPGLILLSPAGFVVRLDVGSPVNGAGNFKMGVVAPPPPVGAIQVVGSGETPVTTFSGIRGTLDFQFTTGAAGTARAVAFLADASLSPTHYLGIAVDATNRPYLLIKNIAGTTVAQSTPTGPAIGAGVLLRVRAVWDASSVVYSSDTPEYAAIEVNGAGSSSWATNPGASWSSFTPTVLLAGIPVGALAAFNGILNLLQVSPQVALLNPVEVLQESAAILANSVVTATAKSAHKAIASISANSSVSATATIP